MVLLAILFFIPEVGSAQSKKGLIIVFRYDDVSSLSSKKLETKLLEAFKAYGFSCTFGVIPYVAAGDWTDIGPQDVVPLTTEKAGLLREAIGDGVLEVALHGYSHQTIRTKEEGGLTEFFGEDYGTQLRKIEAGKEFLEIALDTSITTFIPPGNSYDLNTLRVLEQAGFTSISANPYGESNMSSTIAYLPVTCFNPTELVEAVTTARNVPEDEPIIAVMVHEYDFIEIDPVRGRFSYQDFMGILNWISSQEDVKVLSIKEALEEIDESDVLRYIKNRSYRKVFQMLPPLIAKPVPIYFSSKIASYMTIKALIWTICFYLVILVIPMVSLYMGLCMRHEQCATASKIIRYGGLSFLITVSVYALHDWAINWRGLGLITGCLGGCLGSWSCFIIRRKQSQVEKISRMCC